MPFRWLRAGTALAADAGVQHIGRGTRKSEQDACVGGGKASLIEALRMMVDLDR